ncbi:MAG TPA: EF-hand domain-containing protein, partial [Planctomycetota bacterium]|nr:EF-hand domain-containing protein [Planctomycetota bacterium]
MILHVFAAVVLAVPLQGKGGAQGPLPPARQLLANFSFEKLDADKDGFVSVAELTTAVFQWLDKDGHKALDRNDLAKLPPEKSPARVAAERDRDRKEKKENGNGKETESPASKPADGADAAKAHLERMDKNHDGKITADEFSLPAAWIAQLDRNHDGKISKEEFEAKDGMGPRGGGGKLRDLLSKSP